MQEDLLRSEKRLADLLEDARDGLEKKVAEKTNNVNTLVENLERCNVRERANRLPPHSPMPDPRGRIRELMW